MMVMTWVDRMDVNEVEPDSIMRWLATRGWHAGISATPDRWRSMVKTDQKGNREMLSIPVRGEVDTDYAERVAMVLTDMSQKTRISVPAILEQLHAENLGHDVG